MTLTSLLTLEALDLALLLEDEGSVTHPDIDGLDSHAIESMLAESIVQGVTDLHAIAGDALTRYLPHRAGPLFLPDDLHLLAESLSHALAAGDTLARALVLDFAQRQTALHGEAHHRPAYLLTHLHTTPIPAMPPDAAIHYFRGLVPELGRDPMRAEDLKRRAFTLAVSTSQELTVAVQAAIADRLESGKVSDGPHAVRAILDAAGVSPKNPQYSAMVYRTNTMEAYAQGTQEQVSAMAETFPVWRYSAVRDSRSRPWHAKHNGLYYPASVPFTQLRGTTPEDVCNCRCTQIPISRWQWKRLEAAGARLTMAA